MRLNSPNFRDRFQIMPLKRQLIYINGKDETGRVVSYFYRGNKCVIVFKNSDKEYEYNSDRVRIVRTAISEDKAYNIFNYLTEIADIVGLKTEEGSNILAKIYQRISFIPQDCILANYLNGTMPQMNRDHQSDEIFPFGFNISQKDAVFKAFSSSISVIEGPPGTGKTQTILNIIANAVIRGQRIAVVSSNNSATKNVYEKLEKNGIGFMNKNFMFNVNIGRFAYLTGRSLSAFKRDFKITFNETPNRWLIKKRLQEAYFLIKKKNKKPSDIYLELGLETLSHFSYAFKKKFGQTPTELAAREKKTCH